MDSEERLRRRKQQYRLTKDRETPEGAAGEETERVETGNAGLRRRLKGRGDSQELEM